MKKNQMMGLVLVAVVTVAGMFLFSKDKGSETTAKYPDRTIANAVFSSAGGGTDQWNRLISAVMEKEIGNKITVSNMTGGLGGVAASWVWDAPHDGHRWLGASETMLTMAVNGGHKTTAKDWEFFIIAGSPGVISVPADSPYKTYGDLVKAAQAQPDKIKIANSGKGKLWHMKAYVAANNGKVPFSHVPYEGSRPAIIGALSKEADAVSCSAGEIIEFVKSGKMRPLVMLENEAYEFPGAGKVPSAADTFPEVKKYYPLDQWLGFMLPADTPKPVLQKIEKVFQNAVKSGEVKKLADDSLHKVYALSGKAAKDMAVSAEAKYSWLLQGWGMAKINPEKLGIQKP